MVIEEAVEVMEEAVEVMEEVWHLEEECPPCSPSLRVQEEDSCTPSPPPAPLHPSTPPSPLHSSNPPLLLLQGLLARPGKKQINIQISLIYS